MIEALSEIHDEWGIRNCPLKVFDEYYSCKQVESSRCWVYFTTYNVGFAIFTGSTVYTAYAVVDIKFIWKRIIRFFAIQ